MEADTLPGAALLGTPEVPTLLGYTRRVLHLHDGCTLAVFSYSNAAKANWLFLIESRDLSVERYEIPHNDIASHGGALGADGRIYIMPYGNGRAYRFDVETKEFAALETSLPETEYSWGAFGASNRCIFLAPIQMRTWGNTISKLVSAIFGNRRLPVASIPIPSVRTIGGGFALGAWGQVISGCSSIPKRGS